jgi:hypothetical protein
MESWVAADSHVTVVGRVQVLAVLWTSFFHTANQPFGVIYKKRQIFALKIDWSAARN